jgi:hypothetical protein
MKDTTPRWVTILVFVSGIPSFAWMLWIIYLTLHGLPPKAGMAGMMGVLAGFLLLCGLQFAKLFWSMRKGLELPAYILSGSCLMLVGLLAVMRETGEFSYGPYSFDFVVGFSLAVPFGLSMALALWYAERDGVT